MLIALFSNERAESLVKGFAFLSHAPMDAEHKWCEGAIFYLGNPFVVTPFFSFSLVNYACESDWPLNL